MIGEALAAACGDRDVLARIGGPLGEAARTAVGELATLPETARRVRRAGWAAVARAPVPPGFRGIHPSWIEAALADLPPRARTAVASSAMVHDVAEIDVWLARWACAAIPPLPVIDVSLSRPRAIMDLARLAPEALVPWIEAVGADQLAFALGDHDAITATAQIVGVRLTDAATRIAKSPRAGALGSRRAAIERARVTLDDVALIRIGTRAIAARIDALTRRQLAVRLPRHLGRILETELTEHASAPVDQAPSWAALAAG